VFNAKSDILKPIIDEFKEQTQVYFEKSGDQIEELITRYNINKGNEYVERGLAIRKFLTSIVSVELILDVFATIFSEYKTYHTVDDVWAILPKYNSVLPDVDVSEDFKINILRYLFAQEFTYPNWKRAIAEYEIVDRKLRKFSIDIEGKIEQIQPLYFKNRNSFYADVFNKESLVNLGKIKMNFITSEDKPYFLKTKHVGNKRDKEEIEITFRSGDQEKKGFPPHLIKSKDYLNQKLMSWQVPTNRKKISRDLLSLKLQPNGMHWSDNSIELLGEQDKSLQQQYNNLQKTFTIRSVKGLQELKYKDKTGIAGITGVGKTNLLKYEILRLVNLWREYPEQLQPGEGARIAIWTSNVTEVLDLTLKLHEIGVKAVPIIGQQNIKQHLSNYIKKVKNQSKSNSLKNPLSELSLEYLLQYFKGECSIHRLLDREDLSGKPPCRELKNNKDEGVKKPSYDCPLFETCGAYITEKHLNDAPVWIGTQHAFMYSKPMPLVNPRDLTYAEIAYEEMDVIFVDEADDGQEKADGIFFSENDLIGSDSTLFESQFLKVKHEFDIEYGKAGSYLVRQWRSHVSKASDAIHHLYDLMKNNTYIKKKYKKQVFNVHQVAQHLTEMIFGKENITNISDHPFFELLVEAYRDKVSNLKTLNPSSFFDRAFRNFFEQLEEVQISYLSRELKTLREKELRADLLKKILNDESVLSSMDSENADNAELQLYFFGLLMEFDFHFKALLDIKPAIEEIKDTKIDGVSSQYKSILRYLPFIPSSPTGRHFQYYFRGEENGENEDQIGILQMFDYHGIGREALFDFAQLFPQLNKQQNNYSDGPAMVFMSATMYAEGSKHYHVDVPIDYLLEPTNHKPNVKMHLLPKYMENIKGEYTPILVSGSKNKKESLRKLTRELVGDIRKELKHWSDDNNRKVMLVVNSFEQSVLVVDVLKGEFGDKVVGLDEVGDVEELPQMDIDILVVPLQSINRGYNILQYDDINKKFLNKAYFGSVFFLVRPLIPIEDISNIIRMLNGKYKSIEHELNQLKVEGNNEKLFYEGVKHIRRRSNRYFYNLLSYKYSWSDLNDEDKKAISLYVLVNLIQMIGRLVRGQASARIFFCDASFATDKLNNNSKSSDKSMLTMIEEIFNQEWENEMAKDVLYSWFIEGLKGMEIIDEQNEVLLI